MPPTKSAVAWRAGRLNGGTEKQCVFKIWGKNASQATVRGLLPMLRHQLIAWKESRFQEFQTVQGFTQSFQVRPFSVLHSADNGFGIMQLTSGTIIIEELWIWTANVLEGKSRAEGFTSNALTYNNQVQQGQPWTSATGGTPPNEGVAFPNAPEFNSDQLDRETWPRYNSGFRYYNWDNDTNAWVNRAPAADGNLYADDLATRRDNIAMGQYPPLWGAN